MGDVKWHPIAEFTDALTGEKPLLVWIWGAEYTATATKEKDGFGWWVEDAGFTRDQPSHYAVINPPT